MGYLYDVKVTGEMLSTDDASTIIDDLSDAISDVLQTHVDYGDHGDVFELWWDDRNRTEHDVKILLAGLCERYNCKMEVEYYSEGELSVFFVGKGGEAAQAERDAGEVIDALHRLQPRMELLTQDRRMQLVQVMREVIDTDLLIEQGSLTVMDLNSVP